jgi:hypothetical protein
MKRSKFLAGLATVALSFGMMVTGCDNGITNNGDGSGYSLTTQENYQAVVSGDGGAGDGYDGDYGYSVGNGPDDDDGYDGDYGYSVGNGPDDDDGGAGDGYDGDYGYSVDNGPDYDDR